MHVSKRQGIRSIAFTEDEFSKLMSGYDRLLELANYRDESIAPDAVIENAESILVGALELLATDDGETE